MILTQGLIAYGVLEVEDARQLASTYLILGELLGGAVFGAGMALTRGCPARFFVHSTNGNLRAIISFAIFALVAYATFGGRCSRRGRRGVVERGRGAT